MKLFILLLLSIPSFVNAADIVVEAIGGGDSTLTHAGQSHAVKINDTFGSSDKLQVGKKAAVDLRLQDNTLVRAGAGSLVELKANSLHLLSGSVRVLVPEKKAGDKKAGIRFQLSTPEGSVGVRGTEFITDRMKDSTTVHTLRGEVLFGPSSDFSNLANFSVVTKGYESTIKVGEKRPSTPKQFSVDSYLPSANLQNFSSLQNRQAGMQQPRSAITKAQGQESDSATAVANPNKKMEQSKNSNADSSLASANPNDRLIDATVRGDIEAMDAALHAGADPKTAVMPETGDSILHVAAASEQLVAIQYIIEKVGIPVDYPNIKGQTALMEAAREAVNQDVVLLLLQNKASRSVKDRAGNTAVDYAKGNQNSKAMLSLLQSYSP